MARNHERAVSGLVDDYLHKKQHQQRNPVIDFLFTYYNYRPAALKKWSPGAGVLLKDAAGNILFRGDEFTVEGDDVILKPGAFPQRRHRAVRWMHHLLVSTAERQPSLNCCGMHEWAMVYKTDDIRHSQFPLRLSPVEIAEFVDSHPVNCTHYDAFRFFTPAARPLNKLNPSRDNFEDMEQPGCLHTNMDLYKWAYKLSPWVPSAVLLKAFRLAMEARKLDMRAGPYDLREIGYEPVPIETEAGRVQYKKQQAEIWKKSIPVREELIASIEFFLPTPAEYEA